MKIPIIYALSDPITNEIRYIGKTQNELYKRLSGHYKDKRNCYKTYWIDSLKSKGLKPLISIIEECTKENWEEREKYWIKYYKDNGNKLTNWLEGGQGLPYGYKHTPEAIEKIRKAAKRPNSGKFIKGRKWEKKQAEGNWKKILQYDSEGVFLKEWIGIVNAAIELNINKNTICACLNNRLKRAGGYIWKYYSENYPNKIPPYINSSIKTGRYIGVSVKKRQAKLNKK